MRIFMFIKLLFLPLLLFGQEKAKYISINKEDIEIYKENNYNFFVEKGTSIPLNGFYKVNTDSISYYLTAYENGIELFNVYFVIRYYKNETLERFDIKGMTVLDNEGYYSFPKFVNKSNIYVEVDYKDYYTNRIVKKGTAYQKIKKDKEGNRYFFWKIIFTDNTKKKLSLNEGYLR